jgi:hypothetical protein
MPHSADRRPWLIISQREAQALLRAFEDRQIPVDTELARAMRELRAQLYWIEHGRGSPPTKDSAVARQWGFSA